MKEYLNVGDVLKIPSSTGDDGSVGSVIGCDGNMIAQCCEDISMSMMSNRFRNDLRNERARVISHAINSHDELVARVNELESFLHHFVDNSHNVDTGGSDFTATTCEALEMAEKLDNRAYDDMWHGH